MTFASAYLIRQVAADDRRDTIDDIISTMKRARQMMNPLEYTRTRYVKIGGIGVDLGMVNSSVGTAKDQPEGTETDETITNGVALFYKDVTGLQYCLFQEEGYDTPVGQGKYWAHGYGGDIDFNWLNFVEGTGQLWREDKTSGDDAIYKVAFMCNVPLFSSSSEAYNFSNLVTSYWTSGTDNDLTAIKSYLNDHMITAD